MRYLVTGGAGFIGQHLVRRLIKQGTVVIYDLEADYNTVRSPNIEEVSANVTDYPRLCDAMKGADMVYHLASGANSRMSPHRAERELSELWTVVHAMNAVDCREIVFTSSICVYGPHHDGSEISALDPISWYAAAKAGSEAILRAAAEMYNFRVVIARLANVVGIGAKRGIIPELISRIGCSDPLLRVLGDGSQAKPYIHVTDAVDGILYVTQHARKGGLYNICTNSQVTVRDIADMIIDRCYTGLGTRATPVYESNRQGWPGDSYYSPCDCQWLTDLGWTPKMTTTAAIDRAITEEINMKGHGGRS